MFSHCKLAIYNKFREVIKPGLDSGLDSELYSTLNGQLFKTMNSHVIFEFTTITLSNTVIASTAVISSVQGIYHLQ